MEILPLQKPILMLNLLKKGLLVISFVLIYFLGVREVRKVVHNIHLGTVLPTQLGQINNQIDFESQSSVSFTFHKLGTEKSHGWQYKMPFGSFFLFGTIGLILLGASRKDFGILSAIHIVGGVVSFIFVLIGVHGWVNFLIIPDILSRYLIPVSSLGFVALTYVQKKPKGLNEK